MPHITRLLIRSLTIMSLTFILTSFGDCGWAYAATEPAKVGGVSGTITFVGKLPQIRKFNLATYPDPYYCGRISDGKGWRIGTKPKINDDSHLSGAIVFIKDLEPSARMKTQSKTVKSLNCRFQPSVGLLRVGDVVKFENWDPVLHQVEIFQSTSKGGRLLLLQDLRSHPDAVKSDFLQSGEKETPRPGPPLLYEVKTEGVLFMRCPLHEYMEAWALALNHAFYSITNSDGDFSITNIPAGSYSLVVWHPIGQTERTIVVEDHHTVQLNIQFSASRSTFYREPEVKTNPFGIDLLGDSHIVPSVELQQE